MKSLFYLLSILLLVPTIFAACNEDWECGNPVYYDCAAQGEVCTLLEGVGRSTNRVYWLERCSSDGGLNSTVYLMRAGSRIERVATIYEDPASFNSLYVKKFINANFRAAYVSKTSRQSYSLSGLTAYYLGYLPEFEAGATRPGVPIDVAFDQDINSVSPASYVCWGNAIVRYDTLNFTANDEYTRLYIGECTYVSFYNNEIYWTHTVHDSQADTYETKFYKGSISCENCTFPEPFASFSSNINDFEAANDRLYFARPDLGIESVPLGSADLSSSTPLISFGNINGFKIDDDRVWFNDGNSIRSIDGDGTLRTSSNITVTKDCVCSGGFSGDNCQSCLNGNIQWQGGNPTCVSYDSATGFPSSCVADYNCGNIPFTKCNEATGRCECVTGPLGITPSCNSCSGGASITWNDGIPSCTSAN